MNDSKLIAKVERKVKCATSVNDLRGIAYWLENECQFENTTLGNMLIADLRKAEDVPAMRRTILAYTLH